MKSILIGNGVNIQFGGKAYTSEFILQRIKYKAKQDKYKELFDNTISGREIVNILDGFVEICNDIKNNDYDVYVKSDDDIFALQEFKERYKNWNVIESKDIMLEDWFFLIHMFFLKNNDLSHNATGAIQSFERLILDSIYNDGLIQELHKKMNKKFKRFIQSFDKVFTINYDNNIEFLTGKKVFHLHGDYEVLKDSENPSTVIGYIRIRDKKTVVIPKFKHCFCNALLNYSGKLKYKTANDNHIANIRALEYAENYNSNPNYYDDIAEISPDSHEMIITKIKNPHLQMATEYHFDELEKIESEIHILGLSPNNDSHIIDLINQNDKITTVYFYYCTKEDKQQANKIFGSKKLNLICVTELWKKHDCVQKKYNCNYNYDYSKLNIIEICKGFSEYQSVTEDQIIKEMNTIPSFEMHRLSKLVKEVAISQSKATSEEEFMQHLAEISYIALREGVSPPVLYLIAIVDTKYNEK